MVLRTEHGVLELAEWLTENVGPVTAWLHDRINGQGWSIVPFEDYRKVTVRDRRIATLLLLSI